MAAFKVLIDFEVAGDTSGLKHLQPGGVYRAGDTVNGLRAAEARELLEHAPAGALEAMDEEAETVATYVLRLSGDVGSAGSLSVKG